jgi:hypothetical protein
LKKAEKMKKSGLIGAAVLVVLHTSPLQAMLHWLPQLLVLALGLNHLEILPIPTVVTAGSSRVRQTEI